MKTLKGDGVLIDKLVVRCRFLKNFVKFDLIKLEIPLEASIDIDGNTTNLRHAWETIPSSFRSLAFKVIFMPSHPTHYEHFIEIKASPVKIMHGHNLFGSYDLGECALDLVNH